MKHQIKRWNKATKTKEIVEVDITALKSIHLFCVHECMDGQSRLVPGCTDPHCPLFPYRLSKNPEIQKDTERVRKATARIMDYHRKRKKP